MSENDLAEACLHLLRAQFGASSTEDLEKLSNLLFAGEIDLTPAEVCALTAERLRRKEAA
jgi:hypothetical protein